MRTMFIAGAGLVGVALMMSAAAAGPKRACPDKACHVEPKLEKKKKHCWEIECVDICIPSICFPWTKKKECRTGCMEPRCGRVITVHRLKKKEYECDKCGYEWKMEDCPTCCPRPCCPLPAHEIYGPPACQLTPKQ